MLRSTRKRRYLGLLFALCVAIWHVGERAAARDEGAASTSQISILTDVDLPGGDYRKLSRVTLQRCKSACLGEQRCRAFTYNIRARTCFLKNRIRGRKRFSGATSGIKKQRAVSEPKGAPPKKQQIEVAKPGIKQPPVAGDQKTDSPQKRRFKMVRPGIQQPHSAGNAKSQAPQPKQFKKSIPRVEQPQATGDPKNGAPQQGQAKRAARGVDTQTTAADQPTATPSAPFIEHSGEPALRSSRAFLEPHDYPPQEYAAYGILAFSALATPVSRPRLVIICEAYIASLPHTTELTELGVPPAKQMVTVWPVVSKTLADKLNNALTQASCGNAIDHYHLATGLTALAHAEITGEDISGDGPFLLAWSPSTRKGKTDTLVLIMDLSDLTTSEQAISMMRDWRDRIEQDTSLWDNGWSAERLRVKLQFWADKYGPGVLKILGG